MKEIYTLRIEFRDTPIFNDLRWQRTIEVYADTTLHDLHQTLQRVLAFDDDHLYEFYIAKKVYAQKKLRRFTIEGISEQAAKDEKQHWEKKMANVNPAFLVFIRSSMWEEPLDTSLNQIFPLPTDNFLFYLFDYGDDWRFRIRKINRKTQLAVAGVVYPCLIGKEGEDFEQYPSYEDDHDDEDSYDDDAENDDSELPK